MIKEYKLEIFADYFHFFLQDENAAGSLEDKWTDAAVKRLLATAEGIVGVGTVRNMDVFVGISVFDSEPAFLNSTKDSIDRINECDLEVTSGQIIVAGPTDYLPDAPRIELENGIYRLRAYYGNLDKISEDGLDGDDFYDIHLWRTDKNQEMKIVTGL